MKNTITQKLAPHELISAYNELIHAGGKMQMAYAWFPEPNVPEVIYLAITTSQKPFSLWRCRPTSEKTLPSLASHSPLLGWYEREIIDLFGVQFQEHPEPYPLILHEGVQAYLPPMDPVYPAESLLPFKRVPWQFPHIENKDIQQVPFGPVRAAVTESAQFTYFYAGETVLHLYPRLFFKHRGMEKRFQGLTPELGVILAERVSGVSSVAHALAYCQAIENACDCEVPKRAEYLRIVLAELERLYNHLYYLAHLCHTTTLKVGEAEGKLLVERAKQLNAQVSGSRFLREILTPGGLRRDLNLVGFSDQLSKLHKDIANYMIRLEQTNSHVDRLLTPGVLTHQVALDEGATGPVGRASGLDYDFRRDHPYAAYEDISFNVYCRDEGDAHARVQVRMAEIETSIALIQQALLKLPQGTIKNTCTVKSYAEGLGWAESPRGGLYYVVHIDETGKLARVKIKSPSFSNWRVFPFTVHESNMMDYAINEASFGLTVAGCDR